MGELWFVGAGLGDERDLSERGRAALRQCSRIFAEEYTAILAPGSLERLSEGLGRPLELLDREALEDGRVVLDALAGPSRIGLVVTGDPFIATTHVALRVQVEEAGHTWKYVPNASVATAAIGLLGLQPYRFGRTVSIPFPEPGFAPRSMLDGILGNLSLHLHTLVLLDLRPRERRFLTASAAIEILKERDLDGAVVGPGAPLGVVARLGSDSAAAWYGSVRALSTVDFGPPLHALVVPAEPLHFGEEAAVRRWRVPEPEAR